MGIRLLDVIRGFAPLVLVLVTAPAAEAGSIARPVRVEPVAIAAGPSSSWNDQVLTDDDRIEAAEPARDLCAPPAWPTVGLVPVPTAWYRTTRASRWSSARAPPSSSFLR